MKRLLIAAQEYRWVLLFGAIVTMTVLVFGNGGWILVLTFGFMLLLFVAVMVLNLAGVDVDAEDQARRLNPNPASSALLTRWIRRSRHFRFVGGTAGTILGVGLGGGDGGLGPMFIGLFAGVAFGGAVAELHSFRIARGQTASASLLPREVSSYTDSRDSLALRCIAAGAIALGAAALLQGRTSASTAVIAAVASIIVVALTIAFQRAVVLRPRPALSEELRRADDLMRRLAATLGFTKAAIGVALALIAVGVSSLSTSETLDTTGSIALLLWLFAFGWNLSSRHSPESIAAEALA